MRKTESHKIALCGVLAALSVVLMLAGNLLQIGTYAAPMLACFLLLPVREEYGAKYALLLYLTASLLAVLLVPETELALFYALVVGYYPVLQTVLDRLRPAALRWAVKFLAFNAAVAALYAVLALLLGPAAVEALLADGPVWALALPAMANLCFWLCDRALENLARLWRVRGRRRFKNVL